MLQRLYLLLAPSLFITAGLAGSARGAVREVTVRVDGMACPFCIFNVEKRIKKLEGVPRDAEVRADLQKGIVRFPWKADVAFRPDAIRQAVRDAGFTPREVYISATGRASPKKGSPAALRLVDESSSQSLLVEPDERVDHKHSWNALQRFVSARHEEDDAAPLVRVHGKVREAAGEQHLLLYRWSPTRFGAEVMLDVEDLACEQCSLRSVKALADVSGVIHAEADHDDDQIHVWTTGASPDLATIRKQIDLLGFSVKHVHKLGAQE